MQKLRPVSVWQFCLTNDFNDSMVSNFDFYVETKTCRLLDSRSVTFLSTSFCIELQETVLDVCFVSHFVDRVSD